MRSAFVYIMASRKDGVIYTGTTNDVLRRVDQHRRGEGSAFCARYNVKRLVWYETPPWMPGAIQREKLIKGWPRRWKIDLIEKLNPDWDDLWSSLP